MKKLLLLGMIMGGPILADQFAYITKAEAEQAASRLKTGMKLYLYCAPCGEGTPQELLVLKVQVAHTGYINFYEVRVNDRGIDLAYVYIQHKGKWVNMALLDGLEASDVPRLLPFLPDEGMKGPIMNRPPPPP